MKLTEKKQLTDAVGELADCYQKLRALEAENAELREALEGAYKSMKIALTCNHLTADEYAFIGEWTDEIRALLAKGKE